jgi:NAD(P)-dependent dehydrogenase (short-subunit alcohol dehydrogenase family)
MTAEMTQPAWIVTGPTSGIGRNIALELAGMGTVVLVGRNPDKLDRVRGEVAAKGGEATSLVCDLSDIDSVRGTATQILDLGLAIAGVANNAGIMSLKGGRSAQGWDITFATDHLGPFALTEALVPRLPDDATIVFTCSGVEDPERKPAVAAGFRGGRYISAAASARGEWTDGGSSKPGYDAYATAKQCELASVLAFARETPRLRFVAVEPGFNPGTGLGRDAHPALQFVARHLLSPLAPLVKYWSTPKRAGRLIAGVLTDRATETGAYLDENGKPMQASSLVRDPAFQDRVAAETRELLAAVAGPE